MPKARILVFAGSTRSGAFSGKLAALAVKELALLDAEVSFISLSDFEMPIYNGDLEARSGAPEAARKLHAMMLAHSGVYIATPEYNASIPPLLKNTVDWISRVKGPADPYRTCVFALGSTSPGRFGGVRGMMALRQSLEFGLGAHVVPEMVSVSAAATAFEEDGNLKDERALNLLRSCLRRLIAFAEADI